MHDAALRGGDAARGARLLSQAPSAHREGPAVSAADRRVLSQDQGQGLERQAAGRRRSADGFFRGRLADQAAQSGEAGGRTGAVPDPAGVRRPELERRVEDLPGDAADRTPGLSRAREGLAAPGRHAGRSQGRVRLRHQGAPAARRRDRQQLLAGDRGRLLYRQAGLSRRRRARRRGREIPPRGGDHRPLPAAAPAHHPLARIGQRQDRAVRRRRSASSRT